MSAGALCFSLEPASDPKQVEALWRDLEPRADTTFFLSWYWIGAWLAETRSTPWLLCGRNGAEVVLLALLTINRRREIGLFPITTARLHETGDVSEDNVTIEYNNFLVSRAWRDSAGNAAVRFLLDGAHKISIDELHIRGAAEGSIRLESNQWLRSTPARTPSWQVDLKAVHASGKSYLDHLSANTRQQVRRALRLYEKQGEIAVKTADSLQCALEYFSELKELHQRYWIARGKQGAFAHEFFEDFHYRIIRKCFHSGGVELVRVSAGSMVLGYLYNFICDGHVSAYQSGFAYQNDPRLKPGIISHSLCIQNHVNAGERVYDFLAGDARYKASLGTSGPDMVHHVVQRRIPKILAWNAVHAIGSQVKQALYRGRR